MSATWRRSAVRRERLIAVARGDAPADLLLANARVVNVFTAEVLPGNVAISGERIAGIGDYRDAAEVVDLKGRFLAPGLIDGHTHVESSLLHPAEYARAVVPRGTCGVVTDLHEIANVAGLKGVRYMMDAFRRLPLDFYLMVPSCVPSSRLETSGATLDADDVKRALRWQEVIGLGEMMDFPGVIHGDPEVLKKLEATRRRVIDGHAPGLKGKELNAYLAAGISSDHESIALEEAREKLRGGMRIMIREGSSEKNLKALLPLVTDQTCRRCLFVVDDRTCADLLRDGDIDAVLRKAIGLGLDPVRAVQLATINTAEYFKLDGVGAIAPGYLANMVVIDDLRSFHVSAVFHRGRKVAEDGRALFQASRPIDKRLADTMHIKPFRMEALALPATGETMPVIEVVLGQIVTRRFDARPRIENGLVVPDIERDLLKLVVVERHKATGNIGRGLVKGFGLKAGALATSIAHDSHNIVAAGTTDRDIYSAVKQVERMGGGLVVTRGGKVLDSLALPIAGLLSDQPLELVVSKLERLEHLARALGGALPSPFAALSFLALPVIPELRLTDKGMVDVTEFKLIE
ncbi:MAG: adenine deaminase [Chloroflexi bacterium]|nr:adenine deaminase [Chloroflexota bacterium]